MSKDSPTLEHLEQDLARANARVRELEALLADRRNGSGRRALADRTAATRDLLELFAHGQTRRQYLDSVRDLLVAWTGCRCIGLRLLDQAGRIPYESFCGFDQFFWQQENSLSLAHDNCICIRVVKGQPEPQDAPCLTAAGSFVLNDSPQFLGSLNDKQKCRFRGTCMKVGFASVAVLPIRYDNRIIGAIHVADERLDAMPAEMVEFLETASPLIGEAIHRFNIEDSLRQTNELLERTFQSIDLNVAYMDRDFNFIRVNGRYAEADGHSPEWFVGRNHFDLYPNPDNERIFRQVVSTGQAYHIYEKPFEYAGSPARGTTWWDWSLQPVKGVDGAVEGVVLCLVNVTERKQAQLALKQMEKQLLEISSREQRRIGQDLHDVLGQQLTGLAFLSRILEQKLADQALPEAEDAGRMGDLIKQAISQARALARGLCPIDAKAEGLMAGLQAFVANIEEYYGVSCRFCCEQPVLVHDVSAATHLYHIAQEAVNNAIKHGSADQITVTLGERDGVFQLSIRDNGTGIPETLGPHKGIGLSIMKYRAGTIGGSLDIRRHPEGGTIVICTCPHASAAAEDGPGTTYPHTAP